MLGGCRNGNIIRSICMHASAIGEGGVGRNMREGAVFEDIAGYLTHSPPTRNFWAYPPPLVKIILDGMGGLCQPWK